MWYPKLETTPCVHLEQQLLGTSKRPPLARELQHSHACPSLILAMVTPDSSLQRLHEHVDVAYEEYSLVCQLLQPRGL